MILMLVSYITLHFQLNFSNKTRQVYNGPRTSNLSQQQQQNFGQQLFLNKKIKKKFFGEKIW